MILVIDNCKHKLHSLEFVKPITDIIELEKKDYKVIHFTKLKKEYENADMVILSGTALKDNDALKKINKFRWIKDFERPILGICAGMEIIAKVFGAEITECTEIGPTKIKIVKQVPITDQADFLAYGLHHLAPSLPQYFVKVAKSSKCLQMFMHEDKPIYGILFHPETRNKGIISRFLQS